MFIFFCFFFFIVHHKIHVGCSLHDSQFLPHVSSPLIHRSLVSLYEKSKSSRDINWICHNNMQQDETETLISRLDEETRRRERVPRRGGRVRDTVLLQLPLLGILQEVQDKQPQHVCRGPTTDLCRLCDKCHNLKENKISVSSQLLVTFSARLGTFCPHIPPCLNLLISCHAVAMSCEFNCLILTWKHFFFPFSILSPLVLPVFLPSLLQWSLNLGRRRCDIVLVRVSIAVERPHDQGNSYNGEHLIGGGFRFWGSVHCHHGRKHGSIQADMVLEEMIVLNLVLKANRRLASRQLGKVSQSSLP